MDIFQQQTLKFGPNLGRSRVAASFCLDHESKIAEETATLGVTGLSQVGLNAPAAVELKPVRRTQARGQVNWKGPGTRSKCVKEAACTGRDQKQLKTTALEAAEALQLSEQRGPQQQRGSGQFLEADRNFAWGPAFPEGDDWQP